MLRRVAGEVTSCWLNWAAPSLWRAPHQRLQAGLLGAILNQGHQANIGAIVMPQWVQKKGHLFQKEYDSLQLLATNQVNTDGIWSLVYKDGVADERSERPRMPLFRL
eukprot:153276-Alexandrium_andersonii.AAC.1